MKAVWFESHKVRLEGFLLGFGRGGVVSGLMLSLVEMQEGISVCECERRSLGSALPSPPCTSVLLSKVTMVMPVPERISQLFTVVLGNLMERSLRSGGTNWRL